MIRSGRKKMNNRGSAMILVLVVLSFIMILGVMVMGTALLNLNMRGLNRKSDKNFYYLETMLDKIYAQTGRVSSEILKKQYADTLEIVYQDDHEGGESGGVKTLQADGELSANEKANAYMRAGVMRELKMELTGFETIDGTISTEELSGKVVTDEALCRAAADKLKSFTAGAGDEAGNEAGSEAGSEAVDKPEGNLSVSVGSIVLMEQDSGLILRDVCLTYLNPETDIESSITVDLKINVPYVRFINEGDALLDYILVANDAIQVNADGAAADGADKKTGVFSGSIYGGQLILNRADVTVSGSLLTAAGAIRVGQQSSLTIGPDAELGGASRVWADGLVMDTRSKLTAEDTSFYIKDDLTFTGNDNLVTISGNYYGYGNEGAGAAKSSTPDKSSAILFNDKNSTLDFSNLNSLMLAGRAYLRFPTSANGEGDLSKLEPYVYPMGESLAVRTTQTIYLVPESKIWIEAEGQGMEQAVSNPLYFDENQTALKVYISSEEGVQPDPNTSVSYAVSRMEGEGQNSAALRITPSSEENAPAVLIQMNNKIYVYYNFDGDQARSEYFENYLETEANKNTFEQLLARSGITGQASGAAGKEDAGKENAGKEDAGVVDNEGSGAILLNKDGNIAASGSLYQVNASNKDGEYAFRLIPGARLGDVGSSLSWVNFSNYLDVTFKHLKENLAEIEKISKKRAETNQFGEPLDLPVGNYVNLPMMKKELEGKAPVTVEDDDGNTRIFLTGSDAILELKGDGKAEVTASKSTSHMDQGLIVTSGNVTIQGSGSFSGLIMAGGAIKIDSDSAVLTAAPESYLPLLDAGISIANQDAGNGEAGAGNGKAGIGKVNREEDDDGNEAARYFFDYGDAASTVLNDYEDFVIQENWRRAGRERGGEE